MTTPTTEELVCSVFNAAPEIGPGARHAAERLILDFLGVAIAGASTIEGRTIVDVLSKSEPAGTIGVPVDHHRFSPAMAALISGTMGYSIGLTDTHARSITHPGPSVVPAALAVGQDVGATPEDILKAITLGVEVITRIGAAVNPSHRARGFHPTATCNHFGVALATSYLLKSDVEHTLWALGIAGSTAGGLYEFRQSGNMLMALHGGWPALAGIYAGRLAAGGFSGPSTVLEGPEGFLRAFADHTQPESLVSAVGHPWAIEEISMRPYNACRYAHAAIDALGKIQQEHAVSSEEIDQLVIWTHRTAVDQETVPNTLVSARLCTAFNVALTIVHGPRLTEVGQRDLDDPAVRQIMGRIEIAEDPVLTRMFPEKWPCRVEVKVRSGRTYECQVDVPKGDPENPLNDDELDDKFTQLVEPTVGTAKAGHLLNMLHSFNKIHMPELWLATQPI